MLGGAALLSTLVFALLGSALWRPPSSPDGENRQNRRLWIVWLGLVMPIVILIALLIYALILGSRTLPDPDDGALRIGVTAYNYGWRIDYPSGRATEGDLHIPAGQPVDLAIEAVDVIHSLWVPRLSGKMDAIPGQTNVLRIEADEPGIYAGLCAEYCGTGHTWHRFRVIAHDAAGWQRFQQEQER